MADPEPEAEGAAAVGSTWATGAEDYEGMAEDGTEEADDNPHFLPPFANAYNREVSSKVKAKEERQIAVTRDLDDQNERIRVMDEHLGNVKQELTHTQALVGRALVPLRALACLPAVPCPVCARDSGRLVALLPCGCRSMRRARRSRRRTTCACWPSAREGAWCRSSSASRRRRRSCKSG